MEQKMLVFFQLSIFHDDLLTYFKVICKNTASVLKLSIKIPNRKTFFFFLLMVKNTDKIKLQVYKYMSVIHNTRSVKSVVTSI